MKAQELRIGNLVTDEFYDSFKTVIEIDSINESGINLLIEDDGRWLEIAEHFIVPEYSFDKLKPIPLTEEWLLKFGFEQDVDGNYFIDLMTRELTIISSINGYYPILSQNPELSSEDVQQVNLNKIEYVHQLQNLFYVLTGEELKTTES